jgi:hypothetical protein
LAFSVNLFKLPDKFSLTESLILLPKIASLAIVVADFKTSAPTSFPLSFNKGTA